jgi:nucleoside-diphosphate-sugar epimerase
MKILFIGGTGTISAACTQLAVQRGMDLTLLNRGRQPAYPGTRQIIADIWDPTAAAPALGQEHWDVVVDYIAFRPEQVEQRIALFRGRVGQFIFISSASAYQKPLTHFPITESTPLVNPYWDYSRNKIACEERLLRALQEENFPATIIRPSWTYNERRITVPVNSDKSFTVVDRMRRGFPVIVPGDGTSLWTMTHNTDFAKGLVGLLGHQGAIGHALHITSDEVLTWNQIYEAVAQAAGVSQPKLMHIATDFITACLPQFSGGLHGDKSHAGVFDNTKIKRFVPDYVATTRFRDGMARCVEWFDADPARQEIDPIANAAWDKLIAGYALGLQSAQKALAA